MLTPQEREKCIKQIRELPEKLEAIVVGLSDETLNTTYGEGKWTVRQVVHHLADSHINAVARFRKPLTEDNPTLAVYNEKEWAKLPDIKLPIEPSLQILRGLHLRWSTLLSALDGTVWDRTAQHPEDGEYKLWQLLKVYAEHGEKHLGHIRIVTDRLA